MITIYCAIPTPGMLEVAEKLNITPSEVVNLYSLYRSKYNKPTGIPTLNELRTLIAENQSELKLYKFAKPLYKVGDNINSAYQSTVEVNDNNEFILHQLPDNISLNDVLDTWKTIPDGLKAVITSKKDLYLTELWQKMLLNSGDAEYDVQDNPNAGINAMITSLKKLKEYKELYPESTPSKPYKEVESTQDGALAITSRDRNTGEVEISIKKYIGVDEFLNYIQGKDNSKTSEQKKLVFKRLNDKGITLDLIKNKLNTPEKIKQFIYLHELNHKMNIDYDLKNYDRNNMNAEVNVDIETRATLYAWEQMFGLPTGSTQASSEETEEANELPEMGTPAYNTESITVDKESPRAILSREMTPNEIYDRENMIARDFSTVVDDALENAIEELKAKLNEEANPLNKLKYAQELLTLNDPIKGRRKVISDLGIEGILDEIKDKYQSWIDLEDSDIEYVLGEGSVSHVRDSYQKILDNFDILFDEASSIIEGNEKLRITRGSTSEVQNTEAQDNEDEENLGDDEEGTRVHGNEGYTFKIRFIDAHESARAETRKALSDIKQVDSAGNPILNDLGNTTYLREDYVHSVLLAVLSKNVIDPDDFSVKNEDGSYRFPVLEEAMETYPWISQVINKLEYNPRLISIFYSDFRKSFISYWTQVGDNIFPINTPVEFDSTMKNIASNYEQGILQDDDSIFDVNLNLRPDKIKRGIELADNILGKLQKVYEDEMSEVASETIKVLKMLGFSSHNLDKASIEHLENLSKVRAILENAKEAFNLASKAGDTHYVDAAKEPLQNIARLMGKVTELDAKTTFREHGDTYPSYAAPNYIETVFGKLLNDKKRAEFLQNEFGKYDWFKHKGKWSNEWLNLIENNKNVRDMFAIKNVFLLNGQKYEDWDSPLITRAFLREYFAIKEDSKQADQFGWFNAPIFSDTQMATFFKFKKYTGDFKSSLKPLFRNLVKQELRRIKLVRERKAKGISTISNFDNRGDKFCFIPELNTIRLSYNKQSLPLLEIIDDYYRNDDMQGINTYIDRAIDMIMDGKRRIFFIKHGDIFEDKELTDFVKTNARVSTQEGIEGKIEEYLWNQMYATSQIIQILTTDLAYYKDSVDFQKRFKEVYAAGTKLNTNSKYGRQFERTVYISDSIVTSPSFTPLKSLLSEAMTSGRISKMDYDSILYKFKNINSTDGQALRSLSSYRAIMDMLGSWTEEMEKAFDNLSNGNWDMADFNIIWQTIKPFVFGHVETPDGLGGLMRTPHQNKNSEFLLLATYQALGTALNKSPQLKGLNKFMEDYNIDVVQFESAVKVGGSGIIDINTSPSAIKGASKGSVNINGKEYSMPNIEGKNISDAFKSIKKKYDEELDNNKITQQEYNDIIAYFSPKEWIDSKGNIHNEVYEILVENTRAKINDSDIMDADGYNLTTVHKISYNDYMIAQPTPEHLFDAESIFGSQYRNLISADLPEDIEIEIEGKKIKGREEVQKFYYSLIIENLLDSYKNVNKDFSNIESLQKLLLSIVKGNPKYGRDMLNALEIIDYNGRKTFNIPFSDPIVTTRFQELLNSIFKNRITKQYINGAACILVSNFGFTDELKVVRNEDGSVEAIECYLPAYSKKMYEPFLTEEVINGKVVGYKIDYNKLKDSDSSLLDFVGYRIPTEGKYSILPLRIKGFLPQQNGSSIMLPAEITTLSGSDFDVDKLYMMLPSFKIKNNKIRRIKYDVNKEPKDNSKQQRDNALIQIGLGILRNKNVGEDLQNPGNFDKLKHEARVSDINNYYMRDYMNKYNLNDLREACEHLLNNSLKELNEFLKEVKRDDNPLELDTFIKYHNQNMTGGVLIGIYANNTTMQAKFQNKLLRIKDNYTFSIDGRVIQNLTDVYTEETVNGKPVLTKISRNCSQFSAASVDNVKDPILDSLMQNKNTANVACFMLRAGMSIPQIGTMFNTPLVKTCIGYTSDIKGLKAFIENAEKTIADLRNIDHYEVTPVRDASTIDIMMGTALSNDTEYIRTLGDEQKANLLEEQVKYAKYFAYVAALAQPLADTVQAYRADSPNGALKSSIALAKLQTMAVDRLLSNAKMDNFPLEGIDRVISNDYLTLDMSIDEMRTKLMQSDMPMLQAFYSLGIDLAMQRLSEYFVQSHPYVNSLVDLIDYNSARFLSAKTLDNLYNSIIQFALSGTQLFGQDESMSLEEKRAYYLDIFPKEFNKIVHNNPDIAALPFIQKLRASDEGIIMKDSARNSSFLRELLMTSADNLLYMDNPEAQKLAISLFRYAYFKENFKFGPNNFSQQFSTIFKSSFPEYVDTLRDLSNTIGIDSRWDRFITQFYANNPNLIPVVGVDENNYTDDSHSSIVMDSNRVANPKSIAREPYEFIADASDRLYKLDTTTRGMEQVTYNEIQRLDGIYDMNKDSNDIAEESRKYHRNSEKSETSKKSRVDYIVETYTRTDEEAIEAFNESFGNYDFGAFDSLVSSLETKPEQEYSPKEGLEEEKLNPCKKPEGEIFRTL